MTKYVLVLLFMCLSGCYKPPVDQKQLVYIVTSPDNPSLAYIMTPDLLRYDATPTGGRLTHIAPSGPYSRQVFFFTDSLIVLSEVVPWEYNRMSIVNTITGRRRSWTYVVACDLKGYDQIDARTVRERERLVVYWGCAYRRGDKEGTGYALDLKTWTLTSGPDVRMPENPDVRWGASRGWSDSDSLISTVPAGYTLHRKEGRVAVVRDSSGAWSLWDGTHLFPLSVQTIRAPGAMM